MQSLCDLKPLLAQLDPETAKFIEKLSANAGTPIYKLPIPEARELLIKIQSEPVEKMAADIEDITIEAGPTGKVSLSIVRPVNDTSKLPVIMYVHGGGWILGNEFVFDRLVRELANRAHAAVVFINYSLSPEAQYPTAIEECYAATEYIARHADKFNLDASRLVIAGDSVGGNMATVVARLAKDRKGPRIIFQLLFYPVTDAHLTTGSYQQFTEGPWLTKASMEWFWKAYAPDESTRSKTTISCLHATLEELKGLPDALIITSEFDVLRDEGEAYGKKLTQAGVNVKAARCLSTIHDFLMLNALAHTPPARTAMTLATATLREVFAKS